MTYPWLSLPTVEQFVPVMAREGVSEVARSPRGFLTAYRRARGARPSAIWQRRRAAFIARHIAQVRERGEPLFDDAGNPTRRHLALIAWAYSPVPSDLRHAGYARRQNVGPRAVARELVRHCGWVKADARAVTGKKWRPSHASPRKALDERAQAVLWRALDAEVDPDVALVLRLCLVLGLRIAEATTVDRSRVTRDGRGLRVFGKGSKWRTVPLDVDARARAVVAHLPDAATVSAGRAQRACLRLADAHPELAELTPHVLRHTFATNALRRCVDPKKLQAALGHDKFSTTLTYLHTLAA